MGQGTSTSLKMLSYDLSCEYKQLSQKVNLGGPNPHTDNSSFGVISNLAGRTRTQDDWFPVRKCQKKESRRLHRALVAGQGHRASFLRSARPRKYPWRNGSPWKPSAFPTLAGHRVQKPRCFECLTSQMPCKGVEFYVSGGQPLCRFHISFNNKIIKCLKVHITAHSMHGGTVFCAKRISQGAARFDSDSPVGR